MQEEMRKIKKSSKPVHTCGEGEGRCKTHGRPCIIGMNYDDGRQSALERAFEIEGVSQKFSHNIESTHYCDICMRERREGRRPGFLGFDPITQQILPTVVITKQQKETQKKLAKRKAIADGTKKTFGNGRTRKNKRKND